MATFVSSIVVATLTVSVFAQSAPTIDSLYRKVQGFGIGLPQEKVYLHLDNTCYFVGDTIWYKGYVTRSDKGTLTDLSKILYVELLTPDGFLVERQQLEMPNGTANGAFVLGFTLCRILRTTGIHTVDAQLRAIRTSACPMERGRFL